MGPVRAAVGVGTAVNSGVQGFCPGGHDDTTKIRVRVANRLGQSPPAAAVKQKAIGR